MNSKKANHAIDTILEDRIHSKEDLDINQKFIDACSVGDHRTLHKILSEIKDFNIEVTDNLGRTALRLAVTNENIECVHLLLNKADNSTLREALLIAIYKGHNTIAESILNHPQYRLFNDKKFVNATTDSFWQPQSENSQFSPDITPIMLAAQYNRTQIVQILLLNGERIEKPHDYYCKCNECSNRFKFDSLRHAQSRLNAYRGLASESYIALASIDPILTAFELGFELKHLADKEKFFKAEYLELAEKLSEFTCKLLNNVRGRDELEIVLNKTGKETEEKYMRLARLDLAIKYQETPFVAHPNCQQKLVEIWNTGLRKVTKMNKIQVFFLFICYIFFMPIGSIIYMVMPYSKVGKFMSLPYIKFITNILSYLLFIVLIVISSLKDPDNERHRDKFSVVYRDRVDIFEHYVENHDLIYRFHVNDFYFRKDEPFVVDIIICVWLLGIFLREIKLMFQLGMQDYLSSWNNLFTLMMGIIYITAFGIEFHTLATVRREKNQLDNEEFWHKVHHLNSSDLNAQAEVYQTFYWLNSDRFYWQSLDPTNMSEGLFALALILSFSRLCFWLPANQQIGPLQITLGRMFSDVFKFICIFIILFSGFIFGLHNLYWYYEINVRNKVENVPHTLESHGHSSPFRTKGEECFGTLSSSLITMFFAIYALGADDDVLIEPFQNTLTPNIGFILFASFHVTNITVLMSMLIAMLTTSYEAIQEDADVEWKFARTRLYMEFIKDGSTLPIPFNIIPTPHFIYDAIKLLINLIRRGNSNNNNRNEQKSAELSYQKVLERVAKRFLLHSSREFEEVKESDFDELKQNVQFARNELISDIKIMKDNLRRYASIVHKGLAMLGEKHIKTNVGNQESKEKLKKFHSYGKFNLILDDDNDKIENDKDSNKNKFQLTITSAPEENNTNEREE